MKYLLLLVAAIGAYAQEFDDTNKRIYRVSEQNAYGGWQGKSGSASVDRGVIFQASYLYWQPKMDALDYVLDLQITAGDMIFAKGEQFEPNFHWDSGAQVELGYIFPERGQWDATASWTYFHSKANASATTTDPTLNLNTLRPSWLQLILGSNAFDASCNWNLVFNTLDLSLGRDFFLGKWLSFHPKVGFRGASIAQAYRADYNGAFQALGAYIPLPEASFFHTKWHYSAAGIRFGTDAEWHLNSQFSFIVDGFASIVYGRYKLKQAYQGAVLVPIGAPPFLMIPENIELKKRFYRIRTAFDGEVGARWHYFFNKNRRKVGIGAFYCLSYWFNQNPILDLYGFFDSVADTFLSSTPLVGDLQMQGIRVEFDAAF